MCWRSLLIKKETHECGVSVVKTCQRNGYTSLNGCVIPFSVYNGKVFDIKVMPKYI